MSDVNEKAKAALYEADMRYQNVDPREQSEDGWAQCLFEATAPHIRAQALFSFKEELLGKALDEPAITKAESAYRAILPAAEDAYDDTGWAEPMTEAVCAAIEYALDELADHLATQEEK